VKRGAPLGRRREERVEAVLESAVRDGDREMRLAAHEVPRQTAHDRFDALVVDERDHRGARVVEA
jgi:hypothetical protein